MTYELRTGKVGEGFTPYGENRDYFLYHGPEAIVAGPAETGKTLTAMWKLHIVACKYPGAQIAIVRKTQQSLYGTCLQTYEKRVLGDDAPVEPYGGSKPEWYDYSNGSRIYVGGMDKPEKVLSGERDIIYANQAEELTLADWETLTTRTTGRAGNMPYSQCIGDCNPAHARHWILERANTGKLKLFNTTHRDNPTLWDHTKLDWTAQGVETLGRLSDLTGTRRLRLFSGMWAAAEGVIYEEFTRADHVMHREGPWKRIIAGCDEGYTNPSVILVIGIDNDGRAHVLYEFYRRQQLPSLVVAEAKRLYLKHHIERFEVDPAAAGLIAEMDANDIPVGKADHKVLEGIQTVKEYMAIAGDGRARLTIEPECENTIAEFESYQWKTTRGEITRDEPEKVNDHAMDALRYGLMGLQHVPAVLELSDNPFY